MSIIQCVESMHRRVPCVDKRMLILILACTFLSGCNHSSFLVFCFTWRYYLCSDISIPL